MLAENNWRVHLSGSFFITLIFTLITLVLVLFVFLREESYTDIFLAENGSIHLKRSDFRYSIALQGEWKFYDGRLIASPALADKVEAELVMVPHIRDEAGYGTYRLSVSGLVPGEIYALYIPDIGSAYSVYIDARLVVSSGVVSKTKEAERMMRQPKTVYFHPGTDKIDILIQLSNFSSYNGGLSREIKLGLPGKIVSDKTCSLMIQMILFGGILIIALYNLSLFFLNRYDKAPLFFSLFNMTMAFRIILIGERVINLLHNNLDWNLLYRIQFLTGFLLLAFFVVFMKSLFVDQIQQGVVTFTLVASRLLCDISKPILIQNHRIQTSVSIGISYYPEDGRTVSELLTACDAEMYAAKRDGKNRFRSTKTVHSS